jgi:hypothetical protein
MNLPGEGATEEVVDLGKSEDLPQEGSGVFAEGMEEDAVDDKKKKKRSVYSTTTNIVKKMKASV